MRACGSGVREGRIPYRALIPRKLENVLVAGRRVSCDRPVQASIRVTPCCFTKGQAAGAAAAIAARDDVPVRGVDVSRFV